MPKVKFTKDFDFKPSNMSTIAYKSGFQGQVTTECAKQAVAKKVGTIVKGGDDEKPESQGGRS